MNTRLPHLLCLGLALVAGGCEASGFFKGNADERTVDEADYAQSEGPVKGAELDELWDRARLVVGNEGLSVDESRTKFADRQMITRWNTFLAPQRFGGRRTRAWIRFRQDPAGGWVPGVAVQVQRNADMDAPYSAANAAWEDQPADKARADVLLWKIESGFRETPPK